MNCTYCSDDTEDCECVYENADSEMFGYEVDREPQYSVNYFMSLEMEGDL